MKFSCGGCGKKYATAETPAPGRVYKIKCKACGHLIVVKASAAPQQTATTELRPPAGADAPTHPAATPVAELSSAGEGHGVTLEVGAPEPHGEEAAGLLEVLPSPTPLPVPSPTNGAPATVPQRPDVTPAASAPPVFAAPPPAAERYVDLFADPKPDAAPERPGDDPLVAAARASLPDGYGKTSPAPDPFGPLKDAPARPAPASAAAKVPVIAKPAQEKSSGPLILIVVGALVLVGILAFVLLGGQKPPAAPPAPPPQLAATPPVPAPSAAAPVAAAPPAPPPPAEPAPAAKPEKERPSAAERRAREREAKEAREREAREREKAAREARERDAKEAREREKLAKELKAREERDARERERIQQEQERVAAASAGEPVPESLTQDQVQKVLSANRRSFDSCISAAGKAGVELDGRRVMLRLNIQQAGTVAYPTLDDVTLNGTDLGACLKSAARVMVFPKFKGDPMHVEVPLVLAPSK